MLAPEIALAAITALTTVAVAWIGTRKDRSTLKSIDDQINNRGEDQPSVGDQVDRIYAKLLDLSRGQNRIEDQVRGHEERLTIMEVVRETGELA